jgi:uncharacterized protein YfaS (alpha-2-macroglobulin family)
MILMNRPRLSGLGLTFLLFVFGLLLLLLPATAGQPPEGTGGLNFARNLFKQNRWDRARTAFDEAVRDIADCHRPEVREAVRGAVVCSLRLDDWNGALERIRKFRRREKAEPTTRYRWRRWDREDEETRTARNAARHFEYVRGLLLMLKDHLVANSKKADRRRQQLDRERINLDFALINSIAGTGFNLSNDRGQDTDWWWDDSDDPPTEPEQEDAWWSDVNRGVHLDALGRPLFVQTPKQYSANLGPGAKVVYLLNEIESLDTTPTGENAARALLQRGLIARRLYGPSSDPAWDYAEFYYAFDERPSFLKRHRTGRVKPTWQLADNQAYTVVAGRVQTIDLPATESPLALFRRVEQKYPRSSSVPEAIYLRGIYYQSRQQFAKALAEYRALQKAFPKHARSLLAQKKIDAILHPDVLLGRTGFYAAGTRPTLWFAHRQTDRVEFNARAFNLRRLLREQSEARDHPYRLRYFSDYLLPSGRWGRDDEERTKRLNAYLGKIVVRWSETVPRAQRVTTQTTRMPLAKLGAYLVEGRVPGRKQPSRALVILTDRVIVSKAAAGKTLLYLADAKNGRPMPAQEVHLYTENNDTWRHSVHKTNKQGVIEIAKLPEHHYGTVALAFSQGSVAVATPPSWYADKDEREQVGYAITDRPVYRPGDTVHYRIWARELRDRALRRPPSDKLLAIEILDPQGNVARSLSVRPDRYGAVGGEYALSPEAALGAYTIVFPGTNRWNGEPISQFRVEMYKKPEFEVSVQPAAKRVQAGSGVRVSVQARYYFGGPVAGGRVRYQVYTEAHEAAPAPPQAYDWLYGPGYGQYGSAYPWLAAGEAGPTWQDEDDDYYFYDRSRRVPIRSGETRLTARGTAEIDINTAALTAGDQRLTIDVEVRDDSRRTVRGKGSVVVSRHDRMATLELDRPWYRPGERATVTLGLYTAEGLALVGEGKLHLARVQDSTSKHPKARLEIVREWKVTTKEDGRQSLRLPRLEEGQYRVQFSTRDSQDREVAAQAVFWVHGPRLKPGSYRFPELEILPDRRTYKVGQTAHLLLHVAQPNARVLWSDDARDRQLMNYRFFDVANHVAVIPVLIEARHVPNFFVEASVVSKGQVHVEVCEVLVPPVQDLLQVRIEPNKTVFRPGEEGTVRVAVTDSEGKPVAGQLTLTAYDKAVTYIQDETGGRPRDLHVKRKVTHELDYQGSPWQLQAQGTFVCPEFEIYDDGHYQIGAMAGSPPQGGDPADSSSEKTHRRSPRGNAANGKDEQDVEPTVRRRFADTALWRAAIELGADGTSTTQIPWPQSLTTWRVRAYALADPTRVGDATAEVQTSQSLLVRLQTPRFLVESDEVVLSANVHNAFRTDQYVKVELVVPAALLTSARTVAPDSAGAIHLHVNGVVKAGSTRRFDWPVRALRAGNARVTVKAIGKDESDAMELTVPVLAHGLPSEKCWAGAFRPNEKGTHRLTLMLPEKFDPEKTRLELNLSSGPGGAVLDGLPMLIGYPYGCTEQTMSRFYPTILAANALKKLGLKLEALTQVKRKTAPKLAGRFEGLSPGIFDSAALQHAAQAGLERLYRFQHKDGGWGWWADDASSAYMTTYVVMGLQATAQAGLAVRPDCLERAYDYLFQGIDKSGRDRDTWTGPHWPEEDAYLAYVLSWGVRHTDKAGGLIKEDSEGKHRTQTARLRRRLLDGRAALNPYGLALLAMALHEAKEDARARQVLEELLKRVHPSEHGSAFVGSRERDSWRWWNSDIETNAWTLRALLAMEPGNELVPRLARWLALNRRHGTYWDSTRDTALAIAALAEFMAAQKGAGSCRVMVRLDGRMVHRVTVSPDNILAAQHRQLLDVSRLGPGVHRLELEKAGRGELTYACRLETFARQNKIKASGSGLSIRRDYFALGTDGRTRKLLADGASVSVGDLVEVVLTIDAEKDGEYFAFEDPRPAGCEPVQVQSGGAWLGWCWAQVEVRDEGTAFFIADLSRGRHQLRYRLRAETPGTFRVLPARGFAMYAPEVQASSAGRRLRIVDRP